MACHVGGTVASLVALDICNVASSRRSALIERVETIGPTPQNIEVVASPHSNEHSNRCPLEPAVHEVHET